MAALAMGEDKKLTPSPSRPSAEHDIPESNVDMKARPPTEGQDSRPPAMDSRMARRPSTSAPAGYDVPDSYANLDEVADVAPVQNPDEDAVYHHHSLEEVRSQEDEYQREARRRPGVPEAPQEKEEEEAEPLAGAQASRIATQIYTVSYLVLFALFGTLARLGLQALTFYPGAPLVTSSVWPNFAGSLVIGFLAEDRMLFRDDKLQTQKTRRDEESGSGAGSRSSGVDPEAARKAHNAAKKTIPLYIGLATGFCGSFTSFSSFIRDVFLAMSDDLPNPDSSTATPRNGGYSFMAVVAVVVVTVSLSLGGLFLGAHAAIALEPLALPSLPLVPSRRFLDRMCVPLAWGCWAGAVVLAALPPDRMSGGPETWRGRAVFALVFAPPGCLARFYASLWLNRRLASFPLGTFSVNVGGTAVLAMAWVLAHAPVGGVVGCQALQGLEDGFCGCLTTVSTWVSELAALRRRHAYVYGSASVLAALAVAVAIMGGMRWTDGFADLLCVH